MKASPELFKALQEAIKVWDIDKYRDAYRSGNFPRADTVKDINVRYRWDLYWAATKDNNIRDMVREENLLSDHIDTMLRRIVPTL